MNRIMKIMVIPLFLLLAEMAQAQSALNVWIKVPAVITSSGIISGTTNLPDGTTLSLALTGPYNSQFNRDNCCYSATIAVAHGSFGPVSIVSTGVYPLPGNYTVSIIMQDWSMQPDNVVAVIGKNAANLSGPLVVGGSNPNVEASIPVVVR